MIYNLHVLFGGSLKQQASKHPRKWWGKFPTNMKHDTPLSKVSLKNDLALLPDIFWTMPMTGYGG